MRKKKERVGGKEPVIRIPTGIVTVPVERQVSYHRKQVDAFVFIDRQKMEDKEDG